MPTDMRPYAESTAKAMPWRFRFLYSMGHWSLWDLTSSAELTSVSTTSEQWAFWGPLGSEFGIKSLNPHLYKDQYDQHSGSGYYKFDDLLEAIADAVCQEAESRRKEVEPTP